LSAPQWVQGPETAGVLAIACIHDRVKAATAPNALCTPSNCRFSVRSILKASEKGTKPFGAGGVEPDLGSLTQGLR